MDNLELEFNELINIIKDTKEYKNYVSLKDRLESNDDISSLVKEIKDLQKESVRLESKGQDFSKVDLDIKQKLVYLNNIPVYNDYIESLELLNDILVLVKNRFDKFIEELLLEE